MQNRGGEVDFITIKSASPGMRSTDRRMAKAMLLAVVARAVESIGSPASFAALVKPILAREPVGIPFLSVPVPVSAFFLTTLHELCLHAAIPLPLGVAINYEAALVP